VDPGRAAGYAEAVTGGGEMVVRVSVSCVGLVVAVVLFGLLMVPRHEPGVTTENFARLREGMTGPEVEAVLGPAESAWEGKAMRHLTWSGGGREVILEFDGTPPDRLAVGMLTDGRRVVARLRPARLGWYGWLIRLFGD
jgi:hypothetical protein